MLERGTLALASLLAAVALAASAQAEIFKGFPDAIVCSLPPSKGRPAPVDVVLHVDARMKGGPVLYKPLGQTAITVEIGDDGVVRAERVKSCDGVTLQQLRDQGRAFY